MQDPKRSIYMYLDDDVQINYMIVCLWSNSSMKACQLYKNKFKIIKMFRMFDVILLGVCEMPRPISQICYYWATFCPFNSTTAYTLHL